MQAVLQAYDSGTSTALIMEDDMEILRWPSWGLLFTAPPGWEVLLLYMMGPDADAIYRCFSRVIVLVRHRTAALHSLPVHEVHMPLSSLHMVRAHDMHRTLQTFGWALWSN